MARDTTRKGTGGWSKEAKQRGGVSRCVAVWPGRRWFRRVGFGGGEWHGGCLVGTVTVARRRERGSLVDSRLVL